MTLALAISFIPLALFSVLAFWKPNALLFMLTGTIAIFIGLFFYDVYTEDVGLAIGMCIIAYGLVSYGYAFRCIFIRERSGEDGS